jgi:hypothetical protein
MQYRGESISVDKSICIGIKLAIYNTDANRDFNIKLDLKSGLKLS